MRLAGLRIFPVKALRGVAVGQARVEPWGLEGDRRWMVVDAAGRFLTQREHPAMACIAAAPAPHGIDLHAGGRTVAVPYPAAGAQTVAVTVWRDVVSARLACAEAHALLADALGTPCRLVWLHDTQARPTDPRYAPPGSTVSFADGFPLLLASAASLADLNARLPAPVAMTRFRPNLAVEGVGAWEEDGWTRIRIGEVAFAVVKACARCIVTTVDPETGARPDRSEPLRTLARFRRDVGGGVMFGQNLVPETAGTIRLGDPVEVLARGVPNVVLVPERTGDAARSG